MKTKSLFHVSIFILILSCAIFFISFSYNSESFTKIAAGSVILYQLKQLLALLMLFFTGLIFMMIISCKASPLWIAMFALPSGCALWSISALLILMLSVGLSLISGFAGCLIITALIFIIKKGFLKDSASQKGLFSFDPAFSEVFYICIIIMISIAVLCASGIVYSFVSYDSFFYFINYGHALAKTGNFAELLGDNSFTLTNIGQFLPMLCTYLSFFGIDQPYSLQSFLSINTVIVFVSGLFHLLSNKGNSHKYRLPYTCLFGILLLVSTPYIIISSWMLANMYCMVYIFIAYMVSSLYEKKIISDWNCFFMTSMSYISLVLIRKDGIIFAAFLFICFILTHSHRVLKKQAALIFLPAALAEVLWLVYVRIILEASVRQSAPQSIANNKNILFIIVIIAGTYIYLFFIHDLIKTIAARMPAFVNEYVILFTGLIMLLLGAFIVKGEMIIDNIDYTIRNMFLYPSSWGIGAGIFGILLVLSLIKSPAFDREHFTWTGYALLNLVSYSLVDSKALWVNWDDSYNRVLLQIVPVFLLIMALKIYDTVKDSDNDLLKNKF